MEAAVHRP